MARPNHSSARPHVFALAPHYDRIARRIGMRLREMYVAPEADPLPTEHVDLLLRLRQKEREQTRLRGA